MKDEIVDKLKIVMIDIAEITPYEGNAKIHDEKQIKQIKASIKKFNMIDPLGVYGPKNIIVEGHGRYIACKQLGYKKLPCIRLDHLTDEERRAYTLAHNKLTMNTDFDFTMLDEELENIVDIDMSDFGFNDLDDMFEEETETYEDDFDEDPPKEPTSKLGEVYILGDHRLMCGDSTKQKDVEKLMNGDSADMVFTDPPYNTGMQGKKDRSEWLSGMFNDSYTDEEWQKFMSDFCKMYHTIMKENSVAYICLDWRRNYELIPHIKANFSLSNTIVWDKIVHGLGSDYKYTYELINVCKKGRPVLETHQGEREYQDIWHIQRKIGRDDEHATKKPIELCSRAMRHASKKGQIVTDLFGGSGSTLLACEQLERRCYMMELDPRYVDVIINRWENYTGEKAVKVNG